MDARSDLEDTSKKPMGKSTIVRTVVWNPETGSATKDTKVVQLHRSSITSNNQQNKQAPEIISFNRKELDQILRVYGFKVADGEWKDYAIDMLKDRAVFSVFRRAHDTPLHCIEKDPKLANKQGMYSVTGTDGRVLKRGHDLPTVLKVLEKKAKLRVV